MKLYDLSPAEFRCGIQANADEFHAKVLEQYIKDKPMVDRPTIFYTKNGNIIKILGKHQLPAAGDFIVAVENPVWKVMDSLGKLHTIG